MKVLIGTKNKGKVEGAKLALEHYFENVEIEGVSVSSDVPDQPVDAETLQGAENRIKNLKAYASENNLKVDLFVAIESGLAQIFGKWFTINVAVIADENGFQSHGIGPAFPVPENLVDSIKELGLGHVMTEVFKEDKDLHNRGGGIQLLTKDVISRIHITEDAFVMALTRFINKDFWN